MGRDRRILVIGATGNVGAEAIAALRGRDERVAAAVREVARARRRFGEAVECVPFDFARPATFAAAFAGVRRVFLVRPPQIANVRRPIAPAVAAAGPTP